MTLARASDERNPGVTRLTSILAYCLEWSKESLVVRVAPIFVDGKGRVIAHPDSSVVRKRTDVGHLKHVRAALDAHQRGVQTGSLVEAARDINGAPVLGVFTLVPRLNWIVIVEQARSEALASLVRLALQIAIALLVGCFIAIGASYVLAARITTPIKTLQAGAARIGAGDFSHRIALASEDEIQSLGDQFNDMAVALQDARDDLESRIEARDKGTRASLTPPRPDS